MEKVAWAMKEIRSLYITEIQQLLVHYQLKNFAVKSTLAL